MSDTKQKAKRKVYHPPDAEAIEEAAALLRRKLDLDSDFEDGFGNLLKAIAKAYANHLTRDHAAGLLDNDQQSA